MKIKIIAVAMLVLCLVLNVGVVMASPAGAVSVEFRNTGFGIDKTIEGSGRKVIFNQPEGKVGLVITGIVTGLEGKHVYYVYLWAAGVSGWYTGPGVWVGTWVRVTEFTTSKAGHGAFHINILASELVAGTYQVTVWIDEIAEPPHTTVLVSDPAITVIAD